MKISKEKQDKICEQILAHLYYINPTLAFTSQIAKEIARDEEFVKKLLVYLKKQGLVVEVKKNSKGKLYSRRSRWRLSTASFKSYSRLNLAKN